MSFVIRQIRIHGSALASDATAAAVSLAWARGEVDLGDYLQWSDANARRGRGDAGWTADVARAMRFGTFAAAAACWQEQGTLVPLRPDGKPNRPLTAWTVTIEQVPE